MKIIIDNSNLFAGGGLQVAISFLNDLFVLELANEYHIIQSPNSSAQIDKKHFPANFKFYELNSKEYLSILKRKREVKKIENTIKPDVIFTTFGPSYHKSNFPKVVGFAYGYILYRDSIFYKILSIKERVKHQLINTLKTYLFKKNSDSLIFETEDAAKRFFVSQKIKKYVVSNTLNSIFDNRKRWQELEFFQKTELDILCLSANYPHKNLDIIPLVIDEMLKINSNLYFKFHISANKKDFNFDEKYNMYINYLGKVELVNLPSLYTKMNILFMPTLLEIFSTTYLEAMFMKVPMVCSDMSFARDICGDAALYCSALNPKEYATAVIKIHCNKELNESLITKGTENLKRFGTSMDRTKKYLEILKKHAQ